MSHRALILSLTATLLTACIAVPPYSANWDTLSAAGRGGTRPVSNWDRVGTVRR